MVHLTVRLRVTSELGPKQYLDWIYPRRNGAVVKLVQSLMRLFAPSGVNVSSRPPPKCATAAPASLQVALENCGKWPYDNDADEFVRPSCRD